MQKALVIVDTRSAFNRLSSPHFDVFQDIHLIRNLLSISDLDQWVGLVNNDLVLTDTARQSLQPLVESCLQYKTIVLALTPGTGAEIAGGFISLAIGAKGISLLSTGKLPLQVNLVRNFRTLEPVKTGPLCAAFARFCVDRIFQKNCNYTPPAGSENITALPQALLLHYAGIRETEIECQKPAKMYEVNLSVKNGKANLIFKVEQIGREELSVHNVHYAKALISRVKDGQFTVASVHTKQVKQTPPPPYSTQTLLADSEHLLYYSTAKTLRLLKKLFKGVEIGNKGTIPLISYYKGRSVYVEKDIIQNLREYIYNNYGADYLPARPVSHKRMFPHEEAIRPLDLKLEPRKVKKYLSPGKYRLYSLIWQRFVASQMQKSVVAETHIALRDDKEDALQATGVFNRQIFRGYRQVNDHEEQTVTENRIPDTWRAGTPVNIDAFDIVTIQSEMPERYKISELLDRWLEDGNGKVDDFFTHTGILFAKHLLVQKKTEIYPSNTGFDTINQFLLRYPGLVNPGTLIRQEKMYEFVASGKQTIDLVITESEKIFSRTGAVGTDTICPECGGRLINGQDGTIVCEHYPNTCVYHKERDAEHKQPKVCEVCGSSLTLREGRFGKFWACTRYPKCTFTSAYTLDIYCPAEGCDGKIVERKSAKGQLFYGCSRYPDCHFSSSRKPVNMICSHCGHHYLLEQTIAEGHRAYQCPECNHLFNEQFAAIS